MAELLLKWEKCGLGSGLHSMLKCRELVDVTLVCEGEILQAHKSVLAACSPHFKRVFMTNPCQHPIVIMQDIRQQHLRALLDFMYTGKAKVKQAEMKRFMKTAEALKISGLACSDDDQVDMFDLYDEDEEPHTPKRPQSQQQKQQEMSVPEHVEQTEIVETMQTDAVIEETYVEEGYEIVNEQHVITTDGEQVVTDGEDETEEAAAWLTSNNDLASQGVSYTVLTQQPLEAPKNKRYSCSECPNVVFTTEHYLKRHIRNVHTKPTDVSCDFCMEIFKCHSKLEQHVALHHLGRIVDSRYQCTLCDKSYKCKKELFKHQKYNHEKKTDNVSCYICHKEFKYKDTMGCHMRKKHNIFLRPRKSKKRD